jgi:hypothetical protein
MGFHQNNGGAKATYAKFADGNIVLTSREPRDGFTGRTNKVGNTVYEQKHDAFTGELLGIDARETDYGNQWQFRFADRIEQVFISDRINGSYAKGIITALASEAFDPTKPITLSPWRMDDPRGGDKYMVGCTVKQQGQKIARAYVSPNTPADKLNGAKTLPPMQEVTVSGKKVLDDTDQIVFLTDLVRVINERIQAANLTIAKPQASNGPQSFDEMMAEHRAKATSGPVPDDVPF